MICSIDECGEIAKGRAVPSKDTIVKRGVVAGPEIVLPVCESHFNVAVKQGMKAKLFERYNIPVVGGGE